MSIGGDALFFCIDVLAANTSMPGWSVFSLFILAIPAQVGFLTISSPVSIAKIL